MARVVGNESPLLYKSATSRGSLRERRAWQGVGMRRCVRSRDDGIVIAHLDYYFCCLLRAFGRACSVGICISRPQLFRPPAGVVPCRVGVPCVSVPPCFFRVAEVGLFDDIWDDDYESEILPRNLIVQVVRLRAKVETLLVEGRGYGLTGRRILERA